MTVAEQLRKNWPGMNNRQRVRFLSIHPVKRDSVAYRELVVVNVIFIDGSTGTYRIYRADGI